MFSTYEQIGKKEDVANIISNIDPTKTPFLSSLSEERVHNTLFQWQEDHLASAALNAQTEGFTPTPKSLTPTVMRTGNTQILSKTVQVSNTANTVQTYGRAKELAYQLTLASAEIKRDLEFSLVGNAQTGVAGDNTTPTACKLTSAQAQIDSSTTVTMDGGSGAAADISEAAVITANQDMYATGGDASVLLIKPSDAVRVANFQYRESAAGVVQRSKELNGGETRIVNAVDFYRSPFGSQRVVIDRFIKSSDAILYDPQMWRLMCLRPWTRTTLAITGDNMSVMLVGEYGLKHRNKKASALITNLTA